MFFLGLYMYYKVLPGNTWSGLVAVNSPGPRVDPFACQLAARESTRGFITSDVPLKNTHISLIRLSVRTYSYTLAEMAMRF